MITNNDLLEIMEMSKNLYRDTLAEKLNEIIKEKTGIDNFMNEETMVFNRFHMSVFIKLLERTQ